jgi:hypothetical protein
MVDAPRSEAGLRDLEAAALASEEVRRRHAAVLVANLAVPSPAGVTHDRDGPDEMNPGVSVGTRIMLARRCRGASGSVTAMTMATLAPTAPDVNHL